MQLLLDHRWKIALAVLILLCSGRLAQSLYGTQTGAELLKRWLWDRTLGELGHEFPLIFAQDATRQAQFWKSEAQRVCAAAPKSADVAMGAALVLDGPLIYDWRDLKDSQKRRKIDSQKRELEEALRTDCLRYAKAATDKQPQNLYYWRLRALLQFDENLTPRHAQWQDVLDACAQNDPQNGLYDYLSALTWWQHSSSFSSANPHGLISPPEQPLVIHDHAGLDKGNIFFDRAQQKPIFAFGEELTGVQKTAFLSRTNLSQLDQAEFAPHSLTQSRTMQLLQGLWRFHKIQAHAAALDADPALELDHLKAQRVVLRQISRAGNLGWIYDGERENNSQRTQKLVATLPPEHGKSQSAQFTAEHTELVKLRGRVELAYANAQVATGGRTTLFETDFGAQYRLAVQHWRTAELLLLFALFAGIVGRALHRYERIPDQARLGAGLQLIIWIVVYCGCIAVLALAPVELQGPGSITTTFAFLVLTPLALLLMAALLWKLFVVMRRRRFRFSLGWLLIAVSSCAVFFALVVPFAKIVVLGVTPAFIPPRFWRPAARSFMSSGELEHSIDWWCDNNSSYVASVIALAIIGVWFAVEWIKADSSRHRRVRRAGSAVARYLAKSAATAALLILLAIMWCSVSAIELVDQEAQLKLRYAQERSQFLLTVDKEMQKSN